MPDPQTFIVDTIRELLDRRGAALPELSPESRLTADAGLDSLELAELSAALEDEMGSDPFSEGLTPNTLGELVSFYA